MTKPEKQLRLLLVTDFYYPHWTGISKSVFSLTQTLQNDFSITVLTVRFEPKLSRIEKIGKISVLRSAYFFTISRSHYSIAIIWDFLKLASNNDCILINSPSANILLLSILSKLLGKRLLIFHQGDLILPAGFMNRLIEKVFDFSCFVSFSLADKVSTYTADYAKHSRTMHAFLQKFTPVIPPVLQSPLKNTTKTLTEIENLKKQKKILFGFAGRFVDEKGFDILFEAIPMVMKQLPNAHFVIAGKEMSYENFFSKNSKTFNHVKENLTFLGLLDEEALQHFYLGIECIVVPSRSDCFNLVQAEAMLCGTPAIVTDIPGLRYLVKESGFGMLFKKNDPADLAEKIVTLVGNKVAIMKSERKAKDILDQKKNVEKAREFITGRS
jgi:glycosyltransferase involved in cell wall biosynthesis